MNIGIQRTTKIFQARNYPTTEKEKNKYYPTNKFFGKPLPTQPQISSNWQNKSNTLNVFACTFASNQSTSETSHHEGNQETN